MASSLTLPQPLRGARLCQGQAAPSPRFQLPLARCYANRRRRDRRGVVAVAADNAASVAGEALSGLTLRGAPPKTWEVDFCSRPLLDERGKKVWELLITDADGSLEYAEFFPNNKINSIELAKALQKVAAAPGMAPPEKIRFFRGQMSTIISRACAEVGVTPLPSRRCLTLMSILEQRYKDVYPSMVGFDAKAPPLMGFEPGPPQPLPDALRGERWAFVQLPLEGVLAEAQQVLEGRCFGDVFLPQRLGLDYDPLTVIPGVVVFSQRAAALAGWTNGLELAALSADTRNGALLLETGVAARWQYASYRKAPQTTQEAEEWMEAKAAAGGLHFLAIQTDDQAEACAGFWMMKDAAGPL